MKRMRTGGRIAVILVAAAVFVFAAAVWSEFTGGDRIANSLRAPGPNPRSWPTFVRQCGVVVFIAVAGRKVLRIRL